MRFRSGGSPVSVEDLERVEAERHLEEVSVARIAAARAHHGWIELDSEDLVARPPGYFVAVSTDDYFTQARGTVFESGSANVIATESQLHFAVDGGNITFLERQPGCWSDVVERRATRGQPRLAPRRS